MPGCRTPVVLALTLINKANQPTCSITRPHSTAPKDWVITTFSQAYNIISLWWSACLTFLSQLNLLQTRSTASVMDGIPDEVLQMILNYAMIRDEPFCAETCFREAEFLSSRDYELSINQRPHLLDWRAVVGTCRRFRRIGKLAFFSQKVFAMGPCLASQLRNLQVTCLSVEDQQIAVKYIRSIIWMENDTTSPSAFLTLSCHISAFPRLIRLDHLFCCARGEPEHFIIGAAQNRRQAWSHFTDVLALIGIPVGRLDVGIMSSSDTMWSQHERALKYYVYPALIATASMKAQYVQTQI